MPITPALLRAGLRAVNISGHMLERLGRRPVALDERSLLEAARRVTGLDDFGGDEFREPLRILLRGYETEARLTLLGRIAARRDTLVAPRQPPAAGGRPPAPSRDRRASASCGPLFIVGLPRTGSTLLHHLLAQDPASRVAQAWEVMSPVAAARARALRDRSPHRAGRAPAPLARRPGPRLQDHPPAGRAAGPGMHRHHGLHVPEPALPHDVSRAHLPGVAGAPGPAAGLRVPPARAPASAVAGARRALGPQGAVAPLGLRGALRHLSRRPRRPDAPRSAHRPRPRWPASPRSSRAPSPTSWISRRSACEVTRRWATGLERAMQFRRSGSLPAERFLDVQLPRAGGGSPRGDPTAIYAHFDLPLGAEAERRMRRHLAEYPKDKHGSARLHPRRVRARSRRARAPLQGLLRALRDRAGSGRPGRRRTDARTGHDRLPRRSTSLRDLAARVVTLAALRPILVIAGIAVRRRPGDPGGPGHDLERIPRPVVAPARDHGLSRMPGRPGGHPRVALHVPRASALLRPLARRSPGRGGRESRQPRPHRWAESR